MQQHVSDELLSVYIDGELTEERMQEIRRHLEDCAACAQKCGSMQKLWDAVGSLPPESPMPFFYTRVAARLHRAERYATLKERILVPLSFALVLFLGVITGSMFGGGRQQDAAFAETSVTLEYLENHLQDFPEASFAQDYVELAVLSVGQQ
ncbi:zf-HC2 domain-containing protein [bacterium]|nr:zf-HC2 domain-containing protein [bacterium]